jgi:hypothetical protein
MQVAGAELTLPPPAAQAKDSSRFVSRMFRKYYMPALLSVPGVVAVLAATAGMFATGAWAVLQVSSATNTSTATTVNTVMTHYDH